MREALEEYLRANFWAIAGAGKVPFLLGVLLALAFMVPLLVLSWHRRWLSGRWGAFAVAVLALLGLGASAAIGGLTAGPACAERAVFGLGERADDLGLVEPVGTALLVPVVEAFTRDGTDDDALLALERRGFGIDLAPLTRPYARERVRAGLDAQRLRRYYDRRISPRVAVPLAKLPSVAREWALEAIQDEVEPLAAALPGLAESLELDADGHLQAADAMAQIVPRFLERYAPGRARAFAERHRPWAIGAALGLWTLVLGASLLVARLVRPRPPA